MEHYKNLSLDPITEIIDGIAYTEEWRDVVGWDGLYQISSFGRVKSLPKRKRIILRDKSIGYGVTKERMIKASLTGKGYLRIELNNVDTIKMYFVHQLVGKAFLLNPENKPTVNHKKPITTNNFIGNLEWATPQEQLDHAISLGRRTKPDGTHCASKLSMDAIRKIRTGKQPLSDLAKEYGVTESAICYARKHSKAKI